MQICAQRTNGWFSEALIQVGRGYKSGNIAGENDSRELMKSDGCGGGGRGERIKEEGSLEGKKPYNEKLIFTQLKLRTI